MMRKKIVALSGLLCIVPLLNSMQKESGATARQRGVDLIRAIVTPGQLDEVEKLLRFGSNEIDVNVQDNKQGATPLMWLISSYRTITGTARAQKLMRELVAKGANINAVDKDGNTPLMIAVIIGVIPAAEFLILHGAAVQLKTKKGQTALEIATHEITMATNAINNPRANEKVKKENKQLAQKYSDIVRLLTDKQIALIGAIYASNEQLVKELLKGDIASKENLLERARDRVRETLAMRELNRKARAILKLVEEKIGYQQPVERPDVGREQEERVNRGRSLLSAIIKKRISLIKELLALDPKMIDFEQRDQAGMTPLMLFLKTIPDSRENQKLLRLLIENSDVNAINEVGHTPLMLAVTAGHVDAVDMLLQAGADPKAGAIDVLVWAQGELKAGRNKEKMEAIIELLKKKMQQSSVQLSMNNLNKQIESLKTAIMAIS